jgi:hypothetical protein
MIFWPYQGYEIMLTRYAKNSHAWTRSVQSWSFPENRPMHKFHYICAQKTVHPKPSYFFENKTGNPQYPHNEAVKHPGDRLIWPSPRPGTIPALCFIMKKGAEREQDGIGGICRACERRLLSQAARREQVIRHLYITLNNSIRLLENVRVYVPNLLEWDNMLDHYYGILKKSEMVVHSQRSHPPTN